MYMNTKLMKLMKYDCHVTLMTHLVLSENEVKV